MPSWQQASAAPVASLELLTGRPKNSSTAALDGLGHPLLVPPVLRLLHTALDGTVESFVNIWQNCCERLDPHRPEPFAGHSLAGKVRRSCSTRILVALMEEFRARRG
jgi:hypothetical protein